MSQSYGKEKTNNVYFNVSDGKICQRYPAPEGWDGECDWVQGTFTGYSYYWDEGNPAKQVKPTWKVELSLAGQDAKGEPAFLVLRAKSPNTFTRMLASYLPAMAVGDTLKVRVWPGTENSKVTVCSVEKADHDTGEWAKVPRITMPPIVRKPGANPDSAKTDAKVHEVFEGHPAKRERKQYSSEPVDHGVTAYKGESAPEFDPEFDPFAEDGE